MAHFAEIDENNIVLQVVVVNNNECIENGVESENKGKQFCKSLFGGNWIQTSFNGNIRKNFAGIGYKYDTVRDAFIPPKTFESWVLNEETCLWDPPTPYPNDGNKYVWDEQTISWKIIPQE